MKIPIHIAEKLRQLSKGETLAASNAKHVVIEELISEGIIERSGRIQKKLFIKDTKPLFLYLQNKYGINDLKSYIEISKKVDTQRSELVTASSNSKLKQIRTFKGFLVNAYTPIKAKLNGKPITLNFEEGVFQFLYAFENFIPEQNITIVGIENPENFRFIEEQKYLFKTIKPLFVCRYPQSQSKDLIKWLKTIPNSYLHFGDFDFAGIGIYLNEFKKYIPEKATFLVPDSIESLIKEKGNRKIYDNQKINFDERDIKEEELLKLIKAIHKYNKGLEQEILIRKN